MNVYILSLEAFLATAFIGTQLFFFFRELSRPAMAKEHAKTPRR